MQTIAGGCWPDLAQRAEGGAPLLTLFLPLGFAALVPGFPAFLTVLYTPSMIHDNGASQIGKGLHWHFKRLKQHLAWHFRRYGREGAVLLIDLKGF